MVLKAVARSLIIIALTGVMLFALAGTIDWFGAQLCLAALAGGGVLMVLWLAFSDPVLFRERMNTRQKKSLPERILLPLLHGTFLLWLAFMGWDARQSGVAQMPSWINIAGAVTILVSYVLIITVFRANRFASAIVKIQNEQKVIDKGPYAIVRHPMYGAGVLIYCAVPFTLGSKAGLLGVPLLVLILAIRTLFEERLLVRELPGYRDYMEKVRYRFIPFIW